jgi:hypothetical protein
MTQDTYRFAYDEANAELRDIIGEFEQLQARKEQIEQVVQALKSVMTDESEPLTETSSFSEPTPFLVQLASEPKSEAIPEVGPALTFEPEPAYAEQSSDPFQRRIDNALKHGLGARESRVLPRALNGLLSRA